MSWRLYLAFAALCLIWGLPYFLIKLALRDLSPACIAWTRITLGALILVPIAWRSGALKPVLKHKRAICAFAIAELVFPFSMISIGEQWLSSSLAGILMATVPLGVVLIAPLFGVHERLGPKRIAGLFVGFSGVVALLGLDLGHDPRLWLGVAAMAVAVSGYAVGPLIVQKHLAGIDEIGAVAASLVVASLILLPFAIATAPTHVPSTLSLVSVAILGTICTALALMLFFYLIHAAGAARAALVAYVNPAVASLLGVLVLHEPFGIHTLTGLAMILVGSWLASSRGGEEGGVTAKNA
ncbi:MAG TPA: EamA family transporter [Povalibacter sp.]|uniref:DMT family transporter n=1 Tax=Povalibacter sp. TaxID=1962978 RepID=UPI002CA02AFB|nr:EamA family transporter [Povalibacter sp.]HMN47117.1 EamA family transporter [Povalibacter sp.]